MQTSVIVICMPAFAKLLRRYYKHLSTKLTGTPNLDAGQDGHIQTFSPAALLHQQQPVSPPGRRKSAFSRMLSALDRMSDNVISRVSTVAGAGKRAFSLSSVSIKKKGSSGGQLISARGDTIVDRDAPEYQDYVKYYSSLEKRLANQQDMELALVDQARP